MIINGRSMDAFINPGALSSNSFGETLTLGVWRLSCFAPCEVIQQAMKVQHFNKLWLNGHQWLHVESSFFGIFSFILIRPIIQWRRFPFLVFFLGTKLTTRWLQIQTQTPKMYSRLSDFTTNWLMFYGSCCGRQGNGLIRFKSKSTEDQLDHFGWCVIEMVQELRYLSYVAHILAVEVF